LGIPTAEVELLTNFYSKEPRLLNYLDLTRDQTLFAPASSPGDADFRPEALAIISRLRGAVSAKALDVRKAFTKYDQPRLGRVDGNRVRPIFSEIGFRISVGEEDILKKAFPAVGYPSFFDYRNLLTQLEAEVDSSAGREGPKNPDPETLELMEDLHSRIQARRRKVRDAFIGVETTGIDEDDFRRGLSKYGVIIREAEIQRLIRTYKGNDGWIDWKRFCDELESVKASRVI
jgi:Ca2+-binding EF-hand superfamily protein